MVKHAERQAYRKTSTGFDGTTTEVLLVFRLYVYLILSLTLKCFAHYCALQLWFSVDVGDRTVNTVLKVFESQHCTCVSPI